MKQITSLLLILTLISSSLMAADRKPIEDVDADAFTKDTQVTLAGTLDHHFALVWWIPSEFWEASFAKDKNLDAQTKQQLMNVLRGVSILGVIQADISNVGAFDFYSQQEVGKTLGIHFVSPDGKKRKLVPLKKIAPDVSGLIGNLKPMLAAAMGEMGNNIHFFVLADTGPNGRIVDPYKAGKVDITIATREEVPLEAIVEFPANALFIARKCPNGKDAHISWKFCPWTGELIKDE